ncbi:Spo0E like sporulation regulatory protein [Clostridium acetireducens DSM 10703]|jgi:hypothetical protein|uniref:Spo0E like sporulation regulatory protein n=1 Tax=Clostridium acetireducens DSM 10703 TaxID=1121290 RepID=A0A1E8EXR5_9CLOT|nr:aspartyl-phosphate phosphatase Spo0E family protein [Clostridium acetireducens]OFI05576.1 Spo0E like sporulation regulatory protein [Clostridium acetireducens DSM 10703]
MNTNLVLLGKKIENMRNELHKLIYENDLTDNCVVKYSQKLDKLLVQYEYLKNKPKC